MNDPSPVLTSRADPEELDLFLIKHYKRIKSEFLYQYGQWWYNGNRNCISILYEDQIVAYCAIISSRVLIKNKEYPVKWWVDLIVDPDYRGKGLQTLIDKELRESGDLYFGFPNELAEKIHKKHGWGVRDDGFVMLMPLRPKDIVKNRGISGIQGIVAKLVSYIVSPAATYLAQRHKRFVPKFTEVEIENPAETFEETFQRYRNKETITTVRDAQHINWRYMSAPYRDELRFYKSGAETFPSAYMITRTKKNGNDCQTRILDIFGDLKNKEILADMLSLAIKDSVDTGASQITCMTWRPELASVLRSKGFIFRSKARFCWHSISDKIMHDIEESCCHLCIGDSDNDEPC